MKRFILFILPILMFSGCVNSFDTVDTRFNAVEFENECSTCIICTEDPGDIYGSCNFQDVRIIAGLNVSIDNFIMEGGSLIIESGSKLTIQKAAIFKNVNFIFTPGEKALCTADGAHIDINDKEISNGDCYLDSDLPVDLISFNTILENNTTKLTWATASEQNSKSFIIERSIDQRNWSSIGEVDAAGNSNTRIDYSFVDEQLPNATIAYYRLKQTDLDGAFAFYGPNAVRLKDTDVTVTIYPNPVKFGEELNVLSSFNEMDVRIYDSSGRTYSEFNSNLNHAKVPMIYGTGMLFVEVKNGKDVITQKLIVN